MLQTITTKPGDKYRSIKNRRVYEALRKRGMSKQRAARISNAQADKDADPKAKVQQLWDSGVAPNDIIGIWYSPSDDSYFVSGGDWAASGTGDKVRLIFGPRVDWVDEGVPDKNSDEAKFTVKLKDAGAVAGTPLHGPGGLLGVPGMGKRGRKWGNRRKDKACTCGVNVATKEQLSPGVTRIRGNLCNVHGRYGPCDASASAAKKPKGKKGRKPAKAKLTPEQRLAERQQAQTENRSKVLSGLGISADGQAALEALRSGQQPDASALLSGGFEQAGLVERAADGSYRLTASGRAAMNAANSGDQGRAGDVISAARDRLGARQGRQAAAEQRKQAVAARRAAAEEARKKKQEEAAKKRGSSGGSKQPAADSGAYARQQREAERQADRERRLSEHQQDRERRLREHEEDRARRESERTARAPEKPAQQATAPPERVSSDRPDVLRPAKKRGKYGRSNVGTRTKDIAVTYKAGDPGDYLVVEDREKPSTWHLQVKKNGKVDHRLLGAAWAALHGGYRGNKYQGPNKGAALSKLRKLYERENMPVPSEKAYKSLRVVESGGDTIMGNATVPEAYAHALKYGEISEQWADQLLKQGYIERKPDGSYVAYEPGELVAKKPELQANLDHIRQSSRPDLKSFTVFKSDNGSYRWIARTTTAYRDRDNEIITTKALETDAERMTATGQYGPLRYWHLGIPDPFNPTAPWGAGVDIGDCDYSTVIGRTSIESGTFKSAEIGTAFAQAADEYELSPGFFHPIDQPTAAGEYEEIRRFERSVVPIKYGRASNLFTGMTVKESRMDANEYERRMKVFAADMNGKGVPPEVAGAVIAGMEQADKSAQAQGIAYKTDDPWQAVIAALKAAVQPGPPVSSANVVLKAPAAPPMDAEDDPALGGDSGVDESAEGEPSMDDGEYIGDMSPVAFKAMMGEVLAPVLKMQDMLKAMSDMHGELKGMMGATTKSANGNAAEIAALKARLATLEGDQPAVVSSADVEAALKGAPQAPPDPNMPIVPNDPARPYAAVAARTFPNLYRQNPDGSFAGWQPPQSNS